MEFDPERSWVVLDDCIAKEKDARCRQLLEQVRDHLLHEIRGELPELMATLVDEPRYHIWGGPQEIGPKGRAAVEAFYAQMIENGGNRFELRIERVVVDHDTVVTEGHLCTPVKGEMLVAAGTTDVDGEPVDPQGDYVGMSQLITVWPAAEDGRLIGEDIYLGSPPLARVAKRTAA